VCERGAKSRGLLFFSKATFFVNGTGGNVSRGVFIVGECISYFSELFALSKKSQLPKCVFSLIKSKTVV
jgi:hypothetical protein